MDIGLRLSTLYRFEEYPGPDGANGDVSCNGFDLSRQEMKKTTAMIISIIPVDAKLIHIAEFLNKIFPVFFNSLFGDTTTGDVFGVG
jgi:hypothetical protein